MGQHHTRCIWMIRSCTKFSLLFLQVASYLCPRDCSWGTSCCRPPWQEEEVVTCHKHKVCHKISFFLNDSLGVYTSNECAAKSVSDGWMIMFGAHLFHLFFLNLLEMRERQKKNPNFKLFCKIFKWIFLKFPVHFFPPPKVTSSKKL